MASKEAIEAGCAATPKADLERHIMDINIPKSETEWWAFHEIEMLRSELATAVDGHEQWNAAIEAVLEIVEPYTRLSPLHNYGPAGASKLEKELIIQGRFITEDIRSLKKGPTT